MAQATPNLQKLILATDPGTRGTVKPDDPAYLGAKLWLAGTRRPVARIAGYDLSLRPGLRGGDILDARLHVLVENPVDAAADIDLRFGNLPGDFEMAPAARWRRACCGFGADAAGRRHAGLPADEGVGTTLRRRRFALAASSVADVPVPLAGHVEALLESPGSEALEIMEHFNGAVLRLPVRLPVYRIHRLEEGQAARRWMGSRTIGRWTIKRGCSGK